MTYYYGTGESQVVSFGEHVHGYATGTHPLPASFSSTSNDQAIYHQRLTTDVNGLQFVERELSGAQQHHVRSVLTIGRFRPCSRAQATASA